MSCEVDGHSSPVGDDFCCTEEELFESFMEIVNDPELQGPANNEGTGADVGQSSNALKMNVCDGTKAEQIVLTDVVQENEMKACSTISIDPKTTKVEDLVNATENNGDIVPSEASLLETDDNVVQNGLNDLNNDVELLESTTGENVSNMNSENKLDSQNIEEDEEIEQENMNQTVDENFQGNKNCGNESSAQKNEQYASNDDPKQTDQSECSQEDSNLPLKETNVELPGKMSTEQSKTGVVSSILLGQPTSPRKVKEEGGSTSAVLSGNHSDTEVVSSILLRPPSSPRRDKEEDSTFPQQPNQNEELGPSKHTEGATSLSYQSGEEIRSANEDGAKVSSTNQSREEIRSANEDGAKVNSTNQSGEEIRSANKGGAEVSSTNQSELQVIENSIEEGIRKANQVCEELNALTQRLSQSSDELLGDNDSDSRKSDRNSLRKGELELDREFSQNNNMLDSTEKSNISIEAVTSYEGQNHEVDTTVKRQRPTSLPKVLVTSQHLPPISPKKKSSTMGTTPPPVSPKTKSSIKGNPPPVSPKTKSSTKRTTPPPVSPKTKSSTKRTTPPPVSPKTKSSTKETTPPPISPKASSSPKETTPLPISPQVNSSPAIPTQPPKETTLSLLPATPSPSTEPSTSPLGISPTHMTYLKNQQPDRKSSVSDSLDSSDGSLGGDAKSLMATPSPTQNPGAFNWDILNTALGDVDTDDDVGVYESSGGYGGFGLVLDDDSPDTLSVNDVRYRSVSQSSTISEVEFQAEYKKKHSTGSLDRNVDGVLCSGYLFKLGGTGITPKNWRKRWCILRHDRCLYYYKHARDKVPCGIVVLANYIVSHSSECNKKNCIKISKGGARTYFFSSDTSQDMLRWMEALRKAAENDDEGTNFVICEEIIHNVAIPALSIKKPDCHGYLTKQGAKSTRSWKRRYCVLKNGCLYYYREMADTTALGVAKLHGYMVDEVTVTGRRNCFRCVPPHSGMRTFTFTADNEYDKKRWIPCFRESIRANSSTDN